MISMIKGLVGVVLGVAALSGVGCGSSAARYNVVITPDSELVAQTTPPTIAVDMIAVGGEEAANWRAMPVSKYWSSDSPVRTGKMDVIKRFTFGPGSMGPQTLSRDDKAWESWKGGDTLFVVARLAGSDDQPGEMDARRVIFPLARDRWESDMLNVALHRNRLERVSQPKPEKK